MRRPWYRRLEILIPIIAVILGAILAPIMVKIFTPAPADFNISIDPMEGKVQQGGVISTAITVKSINGYKYLISLSASNQPSGVIVTFVPPFGGPTPSYTSTVTIDVNPGTLPDSYEITINGLGADGKEHSCKYILNVIPSTSTKETTAPSTSSITAATTAATTASTTAATSAETATATTAVTTAVFTPKYIVDLFYASGWMGDWGDITLDAASTDNPHSKPICIKIAYSGAESQGNKWAGIYWQYPENNWGDKSEGRDLTGATRLTFWVRGEKGGEKAEFKVGGITGNYPDSIQPLVTTGVTVLSNRWQQYTIYLTGKDLSHVIGGFCWVTSKDLNPLGCTIYLDDIRFE